MVDSELPERLSPIFIWTKRRMMLIKALEVVPCLNFRNCCRCGREFASEAREIICPGCRKPVVRTPKACQSLSFREKQVVRLVRQAKLNKEIAYDLHLSEGTIKEYLNKIFRKIGVKNRTELAVWALTHEDAAA
jgi:DNA-binding NarL/FixJ family response regulator